MQTTTNPEVKPERTNVAKRPARFSSIEVLHLIAVAAIAVFHTFQTPFESVCQGYGV